MTKYGFAASGGGYRSFYSAGALVWLKQQGIPVVRASSTSSGSNIVLDYLLWDLEREELPPVLTRTLRLNVKDIFQVFSNFLGLRPPLLPNGSHLFTVDKDNCRKSLLLDDPERRQILQRNLGSVGWDILTTNVTRREARYFNVNGILAPIDDTSIDRFMDVFLAGITTIPYFKAIMIDNEYHVEGGYLDNTPLRPLFEDPEVEEIIAIDYTDYDYHRKLEKIYGSQLFALPLNSIDALLMVSDMQLTLPNAKIFSQALLINRLLETLGRKSIAIDDKTLYHKPLHILRPSNLEAMTISLEHSSIQKQYFERGKQEIEALLGLTPSP